MQIGIGASQSLHLQTPHYLPTDCQTQNKQPAFITKLRDSIKHIQHQHFTAPGVHDIHKRK